MQDTSELELIGSIIRIKLLHNRKIRGACLHCGRLIIIEKDKALNYVCVCSKIIGRRFGVLVAMNPFCHRKIALDSTVTCVCDCRNTRQVTVNVLLNTDNSRCRCSTEVVTVLSTSNEATKTSDMVGKTFPSCIGNNIKVDSVVNTSDVHSRHDRLACHCSFCGQRMIRSRQSILGQLSHKCWATIDGVMGTYRVQKINTERKLVKAECVFCKIVKIYSKSAIIKKPVCSCAKDRDVVLKVENVARRCPKKGM